LAPSPSLSFHGGARQRWSVLIIHRREGVAVR
jgi:hypothetical protein